MSQSTNEKFNKSLSSFLVKNEDLISDYEDTFNEQISDISYEIWQIYEKINKINKVSVNNLLFNSVQKALSNDMKLLDVLNQIKIELTIKGGDKNSIQQYFSEINDIYQKNNNNYDIEYCPENRNKLIEMNLKSVIAVAKNYQGLGIELDDLIGAGNVGLCMAYDKFDPKRAKLKENIMDAINTLDDVICLEDIKNACGEYMTYGGVKNKFIHKFKDGVPYKKEEVLEWVNKHIQSAKFNSVATMWIRAYILIEIDNNSRLVKKPKTEIYKDKQDLGYYKKETIIDIDAPISKDNDTPIGDILHIENEDPTELEVSESYKIFKSNLSLLLDGVKSRDRGILLKKFGIGLPRPMLPKEIAEQEGLSIARVSQVFQIVINQMKENAKKYNIDENIMYEALKNIL